jgi:tRNA A37 threonylcarbamoyladenosine modification protein TsaB
VQSIDNTVLPHASQIALLAQRDYLLGKTCSPFEALPVYLRDRVAKKAKKL